MADVRFRQVVVPTTIAVAEEKLRPMTLEEKQSEQNKIIGWVAGIILTVVGMILFTFLFFKGAQEGWFVEDPVLIRGAGAGIALLLGSLGIFPMGIMLDMDSGRLERGTVWESVKYYDHGSWKENRKVEITIDPQLRG